MSKLCLFLWTVHKCMATLSSRHSQYDSSPDACMNLSQDKNSVMWLVDISISYHCQPLHQAKGLGLYSKAVVGGPAGPAMAGPLFLPCMRLNDLE